MRTGSSRCKRGVYRFQRCLDLYLCPRVARNRLKVQPNDILPLLPSPQVLLLSMSPCFSQYVKFPSVQVLKPFPSSRCLKYTGHSAWLHSDPLKKKKTVHGAQHKNWYCCVGLGTTARIKSFQFLLIQPGKSNTNSIEGSCVLHIISQSSHVILVVQPMALIGIC